ncbi:MAG: hypothetical protein DRR08_31675, partial [Candidatus Parabeggiatoa sp. nov. 2]
KNQGGKDTIKNLITLCQQCFTLKFRETLA